MRLEDDNLDDPPEQREDGECPDCHEIPNELGDCACGHSRVDWRVRADYLKDQAKEDGTWGSSTS